MLMTHDMIRARPLTPSGQNLPLYLADIGHEFDPYFRREGL